MPPLDPKSSGRALWRSLDDLAGDKAFRDAVGREFPLYADEMLAPSRRDFLMLMGASVALAGMTACRRWPVEHIVPFANRPEDYVPGERLQFATSYDRNGAAIGLLVSSFDGRPIKIEGNPLHPMSLGATDPIAQGTLLQMYDPDRSTGLFERAGGGEGTARTWDEFAVWAEPILARHEASGGAGLRILAEPSSSPTLQAQKKRLETVYPQAVWVEWDPLTRDAEREGARLAFGRPLRRHLDLGKADVVLALDADLFLDDPAGLSHTRAWARRRKGGDGAMNRMWAVEAGYSLTGASADHRIPVQSALVPVVLGRIAARMLRSGLALPAGCEGLRDAIERFEGHPFDDPRLDTIAADLLAARGRGAIAVGPRQPAAAHALATALDAALGNSGNAATYTEDPDPARPGHLEAITKLASDLGAGRVETLVILGGNPAFDAPADLDLAKRIGSVAQTIRVGLYDDETSALCRWHLPEAHYLEAWGDARGWDGTAGVVQPLIEPLYGGKSAIEVASYLAAGTWTPGYELVRTTWSTRLPAEGFEKAWRRVVHDGIQAGAAPAVIPSVAAGWGGEVARLAEARQLGGDVMELLFAKSSGVHDGRFANCGWLVELPDPITKLTWDNAALLSPSDAEALGVKAIGDLVTVSLPAGSLVLPAFILPGQAKGSVTVNLGWGRTRAGRVGNGAGVDAYPLRTAGALWRTEAKLARTPGSAMLATTQDHWVVDTLGRKEEQVRAEELIRTGTLAEYRAKPGFAREMVEVPHAAPISTYPIEYTGHKWGMAIDLSSCIGCAACSIACQAENNIPVVGRKETWRGRDMQWIRVDRYFEGEPASPGLAFQPMTCHQCENAPCELVCPVAATVHDHEGLNVMVYNRCVGTRYCSNNCPYKVRRFNYFNNHKHETAVSMMVYNPEVTVRMRGVMEKCSYCVQRINAVKIAAKNAGRPIRDGEIVPACAQVCPAEAIAFGDLNDPHSRVRALHDDARCYGVLEEINTRPRTRYLARLRNPAESEA
jgi:MoCo/4Fe-4S cofactor protein with predicted Tat translocation signal